MFKASLNTIVINGLSLLRVDGIKLSKSSLNIFKLIMDEEITLDQARQRFLNKVKGWREQHPEGFHNGIRADISINRFYTYDEIVSKFGLVDEKCKNEVKGFILAIRYVEQEMEERYLMGRVNIILK